MDAGADSALALVTGALEQLALLVLAHLLAALLDHAAHEQPRARFCKSAGRITSAAPRSQLTRRLRAKCLERTPPDRRRARAAAGGRTSDSAGAAGAGTRAPGRRRTPSCASSSRIARVGRIDHQAAAQVADRLGLEAERQMDPRQVVVEHRVEELFLRRGAAQLERAVEAALDEPDAQPVEGPDSARWSGRADARRGSARAPPRGGRASSSASPRQKCSSAEKCASMQVSPESRLRRPPAAAPRRS